MQNILSNWSFAQCVVFNVLKGGPKYSSLNYDFSFTLCLELPPMLAVRFSTAVAAPSHFYAHSFAIERWKLFRFLVGTAASNAAGMGLSFSNWIDLGLLLKDTRSSTSRVPICSLRHTRRLSDSSLWTFDEDSSLLVFYRPCSLLLPIRTTLIRFTIQHTEALFQNPPKKSIKKLLVMP